MVAACFDFCVATLPTTLYAVNWASNTPSPPYGGPSNCVCHSTTEVTPADLYLDGHSSPPYISNNDAYFTQPENPPVPTEECD